MPIDPLVEYDELLEFLKKYPSEEKLEKYIRRLKPTPENFNRVATAAKQVVKLKIENRRWGEAVDYVDNNSRLSNTILLELRKQIIMEAAASDELLQETIREKSSVEQFLRKELIVKDAQGLVSPVIAGAAIERAGKIIDALEYYGSIWQSKQGQRTKDLMFARERWIKCKLKQVDYYSKSKIRDTEKQLQEVEKRSRAWNINLTGLPEYPQISELISEEKDLPEIDSEKTNAVQDLANTKKYTLEQIARIINLSVPDVEAILNRGKK